MRSSPSTCPSSEVRTSPSSPRPRVLSPRSTVVEAIEIFVALTSADGYETLLSGLHGDPRESSLFLTTLGPRLPWPIRSTASFMIKKAAGDEVMGRLIGASRKKDVKETYVWQHKRDELAEAIRRYVGPFSSDAVALKGSADAMRTSCGRSSSSTRSSARAKLCPPSPTAPSSVLSLLAFLSSSC